MQALQHLAFFRHISLHMNSPLVAADRFDT